VPAQRDASVQLQAGVRLTPASPQVGAAFDPTLKKKKKARTRPGCAEGGVDQELPP